MRDLTTEVILSLWTSVEGYISQKQKSQAAEHFVRSLEEYGLDEMDLEELREANQHLDKAIQNVYDIEDDIDDDYEDEEF